jgi:hypothetical protein
MGAFIPPRHWPAGLHQMLGPPAMAAADPDQQHSDAGDHRRPVERRAISGHGSTSMRAFTRHGFTVHGAGYRRAPSRAGLFVCVAERPARRRALTRRAQAGPGPRI